jgi:hypothetical protein
LPRHLAADPERDAWLKALCRFVDARIAERVHTQ